MIKISQKFQMSLQAVEIMKAIVFETELVAQQLELDFLGTFIYHRFNVEQDLQAVELFEYEKLPRIVANISEYLSRRRVQISHCVAQMIQLSLFMKHFERLEPRSDLLTVPKENIEQGLKQRLENLKM